MRASIQVLALALALAGPASAGQREPPSDSAQDEEASACLQSRECRAELSRRKAQADIAEARFQALPAWEKALRWALLPGVFIVLWRVVGRRSKP